MPPSAGVKRMHLALFHQPLHRDQSFREFGASIDREPFHSEEENKDLAELRDTLLPKLISGELRIPDAEKFLEEASV